jgi:spore maturation protein CgeB
MGPRVSFFGSSLVSSYWNGAATYYRGLIKALSARGWQVTFYEPDAFDRQRHRDLVDPPWARVVVYGADTDEEVLQTLESAGDCDILVKASGIGVRDQLLEQAVLDVRKRQQLVIFWDVDAPATLARVIAEPADPFRALIPRYDLLFTYGGGPPVVEGYGRLGARLTVPVYNAADPSTHFRVPPDPRFEADLALLANRLPDRDARVQEFFFDPAEQLPAHRFLLGGSGWEGTRRPANVKTLGHVPSADHNPFNSTPVAVLNVNRDSMAETGYSPPTRVFEAAAAGACLITDAWVGIEMFLEPDREVLVARDGDDVATLVHGLAPDRAWEIGSAARRRVLQEHTYDHRARVVEQVLGVTT